MSSNLGEWGVSLTFASYLFRPIMLLENMLEISECVNGLCRTKTGLTVVKVSLC